jgi:hypothetical protein
MGTNVAASLLYGQRGFLLAEGEPARVLLESGPIVGSAYLLLRTAITVYIGWVCLMSLKRYGKTLPLLLFSGCFNDIIQGQFSQPTELGYAVIAGGLCLAAAHPAPVTEPAEGDEAGSSGAPPLPPMMARQPQVPAMAAAGARAGESGKTGCAHRPGPLGFRGAPPCVGRK